MNMTRSLVVVAGVMLALIIFAALRVESRRTVSVPILMYHAIGAAENSPWCVPTETFRAQMAALREQGFQTILPADLVAHRQWGQPLPRKPIMITFDDGYLCNLTTVEPILKANGLRAIIYLITAQVAETAAERRQYEGQDCLVWPEALAMQKRNTCAFGGHAHTHANLAAVQDPWPEIAECRNQLKRHKIHQPDAFCYPYGEHRPKTRAAVQQAGFQTAVVCEDAVAKIGPATDLFALPRVSVMGGKHEFRLMAGDLDAAKQALACRLAHAGLPIEISAGLGLRNQRQLWLPAREVAQGEFELRFALPPNTSREEIVRLEIWDKHRLFKLATINQ